MPEKKAEMSQARYDEYEGKVTDEFWQFGHLKFDDFTIGPLGICEAVTLA